MSVNAKTPMALYKANLELVLRLGALLQENRRRWTQLGVAGTSEAIERTLAQTERMLTSNDWSSLSSMPGEEFWKSLRADAAPLQGSVELALRNQTEFAEGLKQAFAEWQQQSADALGGSGTQPSAWALKDLMQGFAAASPGRARAPEQPARATPAPAPKVKRAAKRAPAATKPKAKARAEPAAKARSRTAAPAQSARPGRKSAGKKTSRK